MRTNTSRRSPIANPAFLALSCVGFIASAPAFAADHPADNAAKDSDDQDLRGDIVVTGKNQASADSNKATRPLIDTPQTITVISDQVLKKQNLLTLRDALADDSRHHLRRRRRWRRLWRQHQPARLFREQRHHDRRRARQRPV